MSLNYFCENCNEKFRTTKKALNTKCKKCRTKICENCETEHKRRGITCSDTCETSLKRKRSMKKYGVESPAQLQSVREKTKNTCIEKYGVENPFQSLDIKEKIKNTCIEKYGVENPQMSSEIRQKTENTCIEKYGVKTPFQSDDCREKAKQTCLNLYGAINPMQSLILQEKMKITNLRKYGNEYHIASINVKQKSKETLQMKYGVDNPMKAEVVKQKLQNTLKERYGHEITNVSQLCEVQIKIKETSIKKYGVSHFTKSNNVKEKMKYTMIKKYGYDNAFKIPLNKTLCHSIEAHKKRIETMKLNGRNFQSSKIEDYLYEILCQNFTKVERHVPINGWDIDFHIADINVYVNMNGIYWHGRNMSNDILIKTKTGQAKTIFETKLRDEAREKWFLENNKKLIIIWEDEIHLAIQKILNLN